ncbi:MAG: DMT family protein [Acetobacteraceae bacterium]
MAFALRDGPAHGADCSSEKVPRMSFQAVLPIVLLLCSNVFMTIAWYGHLRFTDRSLWLVVVVSWGIAFFEYCLAVPANRIGYGVYSPAQLKTIQEVITLLVFTGFSVLVLKQTITLNHVVGFALIAAGAWFIFRGPIGG